MNNFIVNIGIEIHMALNTNTKIFSTSINDYHSLPNTNINPIDLGYPGTLPILNINAVKKGIKMCKVLNMDIAKYLSFDRKNYFYPDLSKGYQITQQFNPLGKNGYVIIDDNKKILIERLQLEEDTAQSLHQDNKTFLNFNRAGVGLIEIVSEPVMHSPIEAMQYVNKIKDFALSQGISNVKMNEGSLRVDLNISVRPKNQKKLGTKVEIKNMNSINNIKKAAEFEIKLQIESIKTNKPIVQCTKRFDEQTQETKIMRKKTSDVDYKYFPEPNIPKILMPQEFIKAIQTNMTFDEKYTNYIKLNIEENYAKQLAYSPDKFNYFDKINYSNKSKLAKIFFAEIVKLLSSRKMLFEQIKIDPDEIAFVMKMIDNGSISSKQAKIVFVDLFNSSKTAKEIIVDRNLQQISDPKIINNFINTIIKENKEFIEKNKDRPERIMKFILGNVMKLSKGKCNPALTSEMVKKQLEE